MVPEVVEAMKQAGNEAVSLEQLQGRASDLIASHTGAEAGLVTSGSAAALTMGTAAILARFHLATMESLPHPQGPSHFLISREHRSGYDHAVRAAGARFVEVGFNEVVAGAGVRRTEAWEYEAAIDERVAGIVYVHTDTSAPPLAELVQIAQRHKLPVIVDAAGQLPPRENLRWAIEQGADLVAFSGGKAIRGPQASGILCGRRDLIASAFLQQLDMDEHFSLWQPPANLLDKTEIPGIPRHGIGRALKVSKENITGLLVALEMFATGQYDAHLADFHTWLERIVGEVQHLPVVCQIEQDGHCLPKLTITWNGPSPRETAFGVCERLRAGTPPIYVGHGELEQGRFVIQPLCLNAKRSEILACRLREELEMLV